MGTDSRVQLGDAQRIRLAPATDSVATPQHPNCRLCKHFAISWDPDRPYACRAFGFKARVLPSWEVYRADGSDCKLFAGKS